MAAATVGLTNPQDIPQKQAKRQIIGIDVLRFFAAFIVMNFHYGFLVWAVGAKIGGFDTDYHWMAPYAWFGWVGVEIFFVISGFVIAYSAHNVKALKFARSRFIRIYPTAWICASITLLGYWTTGTLPLHTAFIRWLHSLFLVPIGIWIDGSYWTLPIELSFYTFVFLLLATGLFRRLDLAMVGIGCTSTLINVVDFVIFNKLALQGYGVMPWQRRGEMAQLLLAHYGLYFAIGALLWLSLFDKQTLLRSAALIICFFGAIVEILLASLQYGIRFNVHFVLLPVIIWIIAVAAVILSVVKNEELVRKVGPRGVRVCRMMGLMTYPLYLVHQQLGFILIRWGSRYLPQIAAMAIAEVVIIIASFFIVIYLEQPAERLLKHILPGGRGTDTYAA